MKDSQHWTCPPFCSQHLSTFIMDKADSIVTVDDAIKKLVLLDSKDKIWTQEVLLQVTDKAVRLLDCDTQVRLVSTSVSETFCPACVCVEDASQLPLRLSPCCSCRRSWRTSPCPPST